MMCFKNFLVKRILKTLSQHGILESPLIQILMLDSIFHKLVVAVFIIFVTFVVFDSICLLLLPKLLQLLLLAVDLILYHNIALNFILKLQRVQNCLAKIVTRPPCFFHALPLFKSSHWLPVRYRIILKICTITYQALSSKQPAYLHSLLTPARQPR